MPTATPVQFEPQALHASVGRLLGHRPESMYLTHYGRVGDVPRLGALLLEQVDAMVALATALPADEQRHAALASGFADIHLARLRRHGCTLDDAQILRLLALDLELNAQGTAVWLNRRQRSARH